MNDDHMVLSPEELVRYHQLAVDGSKDQMKYGIMTGVEEAIRTVYFEWQRCRRQPTNRETIEQMTRSIDAMYIDIVGDKPLGDLE